MNLESSLLVIEHDTPIRQVICDTSFYLKLHGRVITMPAGPVQYTPTLFHKEAILAFTRDGL
jgi:hypothetical protein